MSVKYIRLFENNEWQTAMPIGADSTNIDLTGITPVAGATAQETAAACGVVNGESGSVAWNKHNQLCKKVDNLNQDIDNLTICVQKTLDKDSWVSESQTIYDESFITSGYIYVVSPISDSYFDYTIAGIHADDITVAGQMTLHYLTIPENNVIIKIVRMRAGSE